MINILEYGAVGDGQTNDAPVIQKAIDTCAEQGGGVVLPRRQDIFFRICAVEIQ